MYGKSETFREKHFSFLHPVTQRSPVSLTGLCCEARQGQRPPGYPQDQMSQRNKEGGGEETHYSVDFIVGFLKLRFKV